LTARFTTACIDGLDEPVRRYLNHAIREGAPLDGGVRLTMSGRIKAGPWLPFTAEEECDGRSFRWRAQVGWRRLTPLDVLDEFAGGVGASRGRLFRRATLFEAADADTTRSAAGRAALEAIWAPASLLPQHGVTWRAVAGDHIVATWAVGPERPQVHLRIAEDGAVRSVSADRWGNPDRKGFRYLPCGCEVHAERRFGDLVVPSDISVGWWFGTPRCAPFFEATVQSLETVENY